MVIQMLVRSKPRHKLKNGKTENGKIHKQIISLYSPYHGLSNALKIIVIRFLDRENGLKQEKNGILSTLKQ